MSMDRCSRTLHFNRIVPSSASRIVVSNHCLTSTCCESKGVDPLSRIRRMPEQVDSTAHADRVLRCETPNAGIIIPMPVVMQPRLLILLLPLKPQRIPRHDPRRLRRPRDHLPRFAPRLVRRLIELVPLLEVHHCICLQVTLRLQHLCGQHTLPSCSRVTKAEPESANLAISASSAILANLANWN